MKGKLIKSEKEKKFNPFKIEIEVESLDEARLLYHVFNHANLSKKINDFWYSDMGNSLDGYGHVSGTLENTQLCNSISSEIKEQGFKI